MANFNTTVNIVPDRNLRHTTKSRILKANYGDGYEQRTADGINNIGEEWDLQWTNRTLLESNKILRFLELRQGSEAFDWYPPGYEISSTTDGSNTSQLIDSTQYFTNRYIGATVTNTTDSTSATILTIDAAYTLGLSSDIFTTGESYTIYPTWKYVCEEWNATMPQDGIQTVSAKFRRVFEP